MKFDQNQKALLREGIRSTFARMVKKLRKPTDPVGKKIDRLEGIASGPQGKLPGLQKRKPRPDWVKKFPVVKEGKKIGKFFKKLSKKVTDAIEDSPGAAASKANKAEINNLNAAMKGGYAPNPDVYPTIRAPQAGKKIAPTDGAPRSVTPYRWQPVKGNSFKIQKDPKLTKHNYDLAKHDRTVGQKVKGAIVPAGVATLGATGVDQFSKYWQEQDRRKAETAQLRAELKQQLDALNARPPVDSK
jgi:hypothetical protein